MRIIGGHLRGRKIVAPAGRTTRPMLDRVREAAFSILDPWLPGALVLDLFAGTGSLGLEALSRGARFARFIERDPRTADILRRNVAALELEERAEVLSKDAVDPENWTPAGQCDIVFFDPPYRLLEFSDTRSRLFTSIAALVARLAREGVLVFHGPRQAVSEPDLAEHLPNGCVVRQRLYGTNAMWYVQREETE